MNYINPTRHRKEGVLGVPVHLGRPLPNSVLIPVAERASGLALSRLHNGQCRQPQTCSSLTLTTIRLSTVKPDSVSHISPNFQNHPTMFRPLQAHGLSLAKSPPFSIYPLKILSHLVLTKIWHFSEDPVSFQILSGSWLSLSYPRVTKSGSGCVLLLITNFTSLTCPSVQDHASPLRSWLTTHYFLTAVILRSSGSPLYSFSPTLFQKDRHHF